MTTFRRSGSLAAFFYSGALPELRSEEFRSALEKHRFRTIENAASEEISIGWVTQGDPTGDSFENEDIDAGHALWLRMRVDKKMLPQKWVAIYRAAQERSCGRALSVREKRELKDDLMDKLLPRVLPSVQFVDALVFPDRSLVQLFATSKSHREAFGKLFFETFGLPLEAADPYQLALRAGLDREQLTLLEQVRPVPWPEREQRRAAPVQARAMTASVEQGQEVES